jgi:uncharacterized membrane protein
MNTAGRRLAEVERYIHELAIALSGLPADEREDVIAGIREHIDDALLGIAEPTSADVRRILDDLGDPLAIAADAGATQIGRETRPNVSPPDRPESASGARLLERDWVPVAPLFAFGVGVVFTLAGFGALAVLGWLAGVAILVGSPLWRAAEKATATGVVLIALLALGFYQALDFHPGFGWRLYPGLFGVIGLVAVLVAGVVLWRRAAPRVPQPATPASDPSTTTVHPGAAALVSSPASGPPSTPPLLQRDWIPAAVMLAFAVAALLVWAWGYWAVGFAAALWLLGLVVLWASPLWRTVERMVGTAAFIIGPAMLVTLGSSWRPIGGLIGDHLYRGPAGRSWFELSGRFGGFVELVGFVVLAGLAAVGIWLLRRGSVRARG